MFLKQTSIQGPNRTLNNQMSSNGAQHKWSIHYPDVLHFLLRKVYWCTSRTLPELIVNNKTFLIFKMRAEAHVRVFIRGTREPQQIAERIKENANI